MTGYYVDWIDVDERAYKTEGPLTLEEACKARDVDRYNRRVRWGP
jgi:hypothetical protein